IGVGTEDCLGVERLVPLDELEADRWTLAVEVQAVNRSSLRDVGFKENVLRQAVERFRELLAVDGFQRNATSDGLPGLLARCGRFIASVDGDGSFGTLSRNRKIGNHFRLR